MVGARGGRLTGLLLCAALLALAAACALEPPRPPTRGQVLERILPATVQVSLEQEGRRFRSGSGVLIGSRPAAHGSECFVLTSGHTLAGFATPQEVYALLDRHQGKGAKIRARLLASRDAEGLDLALLSIETDRCPVARLGEPPALGDSIWVVAFPWGRNMTLVGGIVSQLNAEPPTGQEGESRLMIDASVSYGASGGGVFDAESGRLVGLIEGYRTARVSFKGDGAQRYLEVPVPGETYVTPLADVRRFLTESGFAHLLGTPPTRTLATPRP
jgi:serine protease Do